MATESQAPPIGQVLSPSKLAHVVLRTTVANHKTMVDFYLTFLGARISYASEGLAFLTYDSEHHRVAIVADPTVQPRVPKAAGLHHIAFTFDTLADLLRAYQQRKVLGITPAWCVNHGPTTSMYYKDPDGNHIETQVDNLDSPEADNAFLAGPLFTENPIGVDFDPEDLLKRLQSGENDKELKKRREIGPRGFDTVPIMH